MWNQHWPYSWCMFCVYCEWLIVACHFKEKQNVCLHKVLLKCNNFPHWNHFSPGLILITPTLQSNSRWIKILSYIFSPSCFNWKRQVYGSKCCKWRFVLTSYFTSIVWRIRKAQKRHALVHLHCAALSSSHHEVPGGHQSSCTSKERWEKEETCISFALLHY